MEFAKQPLLRSIYRLTDKPSADVPMGVQSAGHYRVRPPFLCNVRVKPYIQVFWCVRGQGVIEFYGREKLLKPHQVAIYLPGMLHKWFPRKNEWEFYWFTLDGAYAVPILMSFGLNADVHEAGPAPRPLFRRLQSALRNPFRQSEIRASIIAYHILALAALHRHGQADENVNQAMERINQEWGSPAFNVKTLAAGLKLHRSTLSRRFHVKTGVSPSHYITRLRIQSVMSMLRHTSRPVAEIAARCGFSDQGYMARVFRRLTGVSPLRFRAQRGQTGGA